MTHLFRPVDTPDAPISPSWRQWRGLLYVALARTLVLCGRVFFNPAVRKTAGALLLLVGLVVQVVLLFVVGYLIDLGINLMELWADLARKHLELTM